jgi:hypothetical protein
MTLLERLLLGGLGGATPIVVQAVFTAEGEQIVRWLMTLDAHWLELLGFLIKAVFLFLLGALWAYLHKSERDRLKVFQLGIVAPAVLAGMISAQARDAELAPDAADPGASTSVDVEFSLFARAHAAEDEASNDSAFERLLVGFMGIDRTRIETIQERAVRQVNTQHAREIERVRQDAVANARETVEQEFSVQLRQTRDTLERMERENEQIRADRRELQEALERAAPELSEVREENESLRVRLERAQRDAAQLERELRAREMDVATLQKSLEASQARLEAIERELRRDNRPNPPILSPN